MQINAQSCASRFKAPQFCLMDLCRAAWPESSILNLYRNGPKFSEKLVWANSADPDQTAPRV